VPSIQHGGGILRSKRFTAATLRAADCVVIISAHAAFDYGLIARESRLVVDTRNALRSYRGKGIFRL
jgi:UDP-N-acetyl-D-glucosamine dehydrogenase